MMPSNHDEGTRNKIRLTNAELTYLLRKPRLGRLVAADATGVPHVVPVDWTYKTGT